jgi:hypothetical protein
VDYTDEFSYHAVTMIFGLRCPILSEFRTHGLNNSGLNFTEVSSLTPENILDIHRELKIAHYRSILATDCRLSSGVCQSITFNDTQYNIHLQDTLFTEKEYEYFTQEWGTMVNNKIRMLGMLIRSIVEGKIADIPLLINDYPMITKGLLIYPDFWVKE